MENSIDTKAIALIEKEFTPHVAKALKVVITNEKEQASAGEMLSVLNKYADQLKKRKEEITKPLNAALKSARELFKPREEKLDDAITALRGAMGTYQLDAERAAKVEEDKIAARVGEGKGKLKAETAAQKIAEIDAPAATVATASGVVKFRTDKKLKIVSETALLGAIFAGKHQELITVNERALLEYLKSGATIAGAEIEEVKTPINFR